MQKKITQDWAETLALQALAQIIAQPDLCGRFLDMTGIEPVDLSARVADIDFLAAVLEFLLGDEPRLLEFCSALQINPKQPALAHGLLLGGRAPDWN